MICSRHVEGFLCLSFSLQTSLLFWGFGQHLFVVADKTLLLLHLLSFHAVFGIYRLLYLGFLVILLYNENPCHNFYFFAYSIRFLIFLLLTSSLLKFLQDFSF